MVAVASGLSARHVSGGVGQARSREDGARRREHGVRSTLSALTFSISSSTEEPSRRVMPMASKNRSVSSLGSTRCQACRQPEQRKDGRWAAHSLTTRIMVWRKAAPAAGAGANCCAIMFRRFMANG